MTNAWIMLVVAGFLEVGWAIGLKYADGLNFKAKPLASTLTLLAMIVSMYLLAQAVRTIPVGTGYAIWTGIGAVGAAMLGIVLFQEPATIQRLACLLLVVGGIIGLKLTTPLNADVATPVPAAAIPFFIGTYTSGKSKGIYRATLDPSTGAVSEPQLIAETKNPSFLALHPTLNVLYAVAEVGGSDGKPGGMIKAFELALPAGSHEARLRSEVTSAGDGPCFVAVDGSGRLATVANYGSGSVASFSIDATTGALAGPRSVDQHVGTSIHPKRQQKSHAHCMLTDPSGRFALSADLGMDSLIVYRVDAINGTFERTGETRIEPGSGPRHLAFAPAAPFAYLTNELSNTVSVFSWDSDRGTLTLLQTISTLPNDFSGESSTAEIAVHPSGRFVYVSNRGHNSISCFLVEPTTGRLTLSGISSTQGDWPRHFAVTPDGTFAIVANQRSDTLVVLSVDSQTGVLRPTGVSVSVGAPACVRFGRSGM
jgi:6-phosphogluconolactonase